MPSYWKDIYPIAAVSIQTAMDPVKVVTGTSETRPTTYEAVVMIVEAGEIIDLELSVLDDDDSNRLTMAFQVWATSHVLAMQYAGTLINFITVDINPISVPGYKLERAELTAPGILPIPQPDKEPNEPVRHGRFMRVRFTAKPT